MQKMQNVVLSSTQNTLTFWPYTVLFPREGAQRRAWVHHFPSALPHSISSLRKDMAPDIGLNRAGQWSPAGTSAHYHNPKCMRETVQFQSQLTASYHRQILTRDIWTMNNRVSKHSLLCLPSVFGSEPLIFSWFLADLNEQHRLFIRRC